MSRALAICSVALVGGNSRDSSRSAAKRRSAYSEDDSPAAEHTASTGGVSDSEARNHSVAVDGVRGACDLVALQWRLHTPSTPARSATQLGHCAGAASVACTATARPAHLNSDRRIPLRRQRRLSDVTMTDDGRSPMRGVELQ